MSKVTVKQDKNVLGGPLLACSYAPLTGFMRDGCCSTGPNDLGRHVVCAKVTQEFLEFQLRMGNDLISPMPQYRFAGLKPGDRWCVCAVRAICNAVIAHSLSAAISEPGNAASRGISFFNP